MKAKGIYMRCQLLGFGFSIALFLSSCSQRETLYNKEPCVSVTYYHSYGPKLASRSDWEKRGMNGKIIVVKKNGVVRTEHWKEGKLNGIVQETFPNSTKTEREWKYEDNLCVAETLHYISGMPKIEHIYNTDKSQVVSVWYQDGRPQAKEYLADNKIKDGKYYTKDQQLEAEIVSGKGMKVVRDGLGLLIAKQKLENGDVIEETVFYQNGMPKTKIPYAQGVIEGTVYRYNPISGDPEAVETWLLGKKEGSTTLYQNGYKIAEMTYMNNQKCGVEKQYKEGTGELVEEAHWENGVRHGPTTKYFGKISITEWYYKGDKMTHAQFIRLTEKNSK